jgi:hypothetical protein
MLAAMRQVLARSVTGTIDRLHNRRRRSDHA